MRRLDDSNARSNLTRALVCAVAVLALTACGGSGEEDGQSPTTQPIQQPPTGSNVAPRVTGTPSSNATVGATYTFTPAATDTDGDRLSFSVANKPTWLSFNAANGQLSGTPTVSNVGTFSNIIVTVSDGETSTSLPGFTITVAQMGTGTATLAWTPPTNNEDGSSLANLAGYRIYYGTSAGALTQFVQISNPGVASYVVEGLAAATWYFGVRAYSSGGIESNVSNVASKTIR